MKQKFIVFAVLAVALAAIVYVATGNKADEDSAMQDVVSGKVRVETSINPGDSPQTYQSYVVSSSSAMDALREVALNENIDVQTTDYDFGTIVDSINGVGEDTTDNKYWIYYVNGETASVGASEYIVKDGDTILWQYEDAL